MPGDRPLQADRHVAQARPRGARRRSSARVTMPTGFVKSMIQASGAARRRTSLREVEHDRHGAQRLRRARRRRSSPAPGSRTRAARVSSCSRACWPPTRSCTSTASAPSSAAARSAVAVSRPGHAGGAQDPAGEARRRRRAGRGRGRAARARRRSSSVLPGGEPAHELGRVRRAAADDDDLQVPPSPLHPRQRDALHEGLLRAGRTAATTGSMNSTVAAIVRFHCTWCWLRMFASATDAVHAVGFSPV